MTKNRILAVIAAATLIGTGAAPAFAKAQDNQANGSVASASEGKGERKICKRFTRSESRMNSERICLTRAEWKKFDANQ